MSIWDRFALWLWRNRGGYDPATASITKDYNWSLLTRFAHWRYQRRGAVGRAAAWLLPAFIGGAFTLAAVFIPTYLYSPKADEKVKPDPGELLLRCAKESGDVLRCRPVVSGDDKIIPGANAASANARAASHPTKQ